MKEKIAVGILTFLLLVPVMMVQIGGHIKAVDIPVSIQKQITGTAQNTVWVHCYLGGRGGIQHTSMLVPIDTATQCSQVFHELRESIISHPFSKETQHLKEEFIGLLAQNNLIPTNIPPSQYHTLLDPPWVEALMQHRIHTTKRVSSPVRSGVASALLCDMSGEGTGLMFPFIMLPRPRLVMIWMGLNGDMLVGKFLTIGGFTATGQQFGTALGFWGIGFAVAYPNGNIYGFAGYALFVTVNADQIVSSPPNQAPIITGTDPFDNEQNVPLSLSDLSFSISDPEGDLMSYTVTTSPDIGSGSGNLKTAGTYTIPVQGLQDFTQYSWTIAVSDTQHTTEQTFRFTTQAVAPVISNPNPADGERYVPTDLQQLMFTLKDFQGDAMDYTVETSPFIGSGSGSNVHNGTYTVAVNGLHNLTTYYWYVNATDGAHWTRKTFTFQTWFPAHFDPFRNGWQYRKQITIDHTNIPVNLSDFPVLISAVDDDLKVKAQSDGDDIIFMNNTGVAMLLNYEIEQYDGTTGKLIAWVNISRLSSQENTILYMYYGNPTVVSLQDPGKTWNADYEAVWHLNNDPTSTIEDSTINNVDGASHGGMTESDLVDGKIGKCLNFDGSNDFISLPPALSGHSGTIEAWIYATGNNYRCILTKGRSYSNGVYFIFLVSPGNTVGFYSRAVEYGEANVVYGNTNVLSGWHHVIGISDGTTWSVYVDGQLEAVNVMEGHNSGEWFDDIFGIPIASAP